MARKRPNQLVTYIEADLARLIEIQADRASKSVSEYLRGLVVNHLDTLGLLPRERLLRQTIELGAGYRPGINLKTGLPAVEG